MLKLTVVVALLRATAFVAECAWENPSLSRHLTITMPKSTTLAMAGQLYTVSIGKSSVRVNSSDASSKACDMPIDPAKDSIRGEMRVDASDKTIYVLGEHSVERVDGKARTRYTLLMINPRDCSLKSADILDINVGMKPALPKLLTNSMGGVDVYFPSLQSCAPCRVDDQGTKIKDAPAQIASSAPRSDGRIFSFDIRRVGDNYLFAQNTEDRGATIKSLDGKSMQVMKEKQVDYPVDAMANTKAGIVGVCSKIHDRRIRDIVAFKEVVCQKIDSNLDSSSKVQMTIEPRSRPVSRVSYDIDETGDKTYIGFAEGKDLRVHVFNSAGQFLKTYDFGKIDERFEKYQHRPMVHMPYNHWNVRGFIVGKEYCLVTEQVSDTDKHEVDLHDVRCINI